MYNKHIHDKHGQLATFYPFPYSTSTKYKPYKIENVVFPLAQLIPTSDHLKNHYKTGL